MPKSYFAILFATCIMFSCSQKKQISDYPVISFASEIGNEAVVNLSSVADSISYIPLETKNSSLLNNPLSYCYENGKIYILNKYGLMIFDSNGKFIRKIDRKGRGPQEYLQIKRFEVSPETGNILIQNLIQSLNEYDSLGNFIRKIEPPKIDDCQTFDNFKLSDELYISSLTENGKLPRFTFVLYDSLSNIEKKIPNSDVNGLDSSQLILIPGVMRVIVAAKTFRYSDNLRLYFGGDTVRSIDKNMNVTIPYIYDFGEFGVPLKETYDLITDMSRISISGNPMESDGFVLFKLYMRNHAAEPFYPITRTGVKSETQNQTEYAIFDKINSKLTLMKQPIKEQLGFKNDLDGGLVFWPNYISSDKRMIKIFTAPEFLELVQKPETSSPAMKEIAKTLTEEDNPVAVIARLK